MKWLKKEADISNLNLMIEFVLDNVKNYIDLTRKKTYEIRLICEEIMLNIISYSYPDGKGELLAGCEFSNDDKCLTLKICDYGKEFNPIEMSLPEISEDEDIMEKDVGGLGIFLIRNISDSVDYERKENMNILTIKKYCMC